MSAVLQDTAAAVATVPMPVAELLVVAREYIDASRFDAADRLLGHILAGPAIHAEALHLSGFIAFKRKRVEQAAALMERAMAAGAQAPRQLCNLAEVYRVLGRVEEGLRLVRRAAALAPADAVCHFNESMLRYEGGDTGGCIRAARRAIMLKADMPEAHMRLGQALLLNGELAEGWQEYEWRYGIAGAQPLMPAGFAGRVPQWDGTALPPGQRLLLVADQGFGDVLMFARYLPWVMTLVPDVIVASSTEVTALLSRNFPGPAYHTRWDDIGPHAVYCPFSGLPRLAQTRVESIPRPVPYLAAEPARRAAMAQWLDAALPGRRLRVGIAWAGRPTHNNDRNRTVSLPTLLPLAAAPNTAFVSLQKGPAAAQLADWRGPAPVVDADPRLQTFEDSAALIDCLDLVIAVDTSINHLAGAMDRPAWVLTPFAPDWRWLTGRIDSPWYPSLQLYRQLTARRWGRRGRDGGRGSGDAGGRPRLIARCPADRRAGRTAAPASNCQGTPPAPGPDAAAASPTAPRTDGRH